VIYFSAFLARFVLLFDKNSGDLAEDYVSPWKVLRDAYSHNKHIRLRTVEKIAARKEWNGKHYLTGKVILVFCFLQHPCTK